MVSVTLRQLEVFLAVIDHGSFRHYADAIGVSPVSVGGNIQSLEERLGYALFLRKPGQAVALTEDGKIAAGCARRILDEIEKLESISRQGDQKTRVRIALHPYLGRLLIPAIKEMEKTYQNTRLDAIVESAANDVIESVQRGKYDIAYLLSDKDEGQLAGCRFVSFENISLFVSETHPLATGKKLSSEEVSAHGCIKLEKQNDLRLLTERAMARGGLNTDNMILETDDYGLLLSALQQGLGFACLFSANHYADLAELDLDFSIPPLNVYSIIRPGNTEVLNSIENSLSEIYRNNIAS